jgi:hypothetical protein
LYGSLTSGQESGLAATTQAGFARVSHRNASDRPQIDTNSTSKPPHFDLASVGSFRHFARVDSMQKPPLRAAYAVLRWVRLGSFCQMLGNAFPQSQLDRAIETIRSSGTSWNIDPANPEPRSREDLIRMSKNT